MTNSYRRPGVYFDPAEVQVSTRPGIFPRMDIPAFVGIAERGPINRPVCIESWSAFRSVFGRRLPDAYLAHAVHGFFANRGDTCWIVRVADEARARPASLIMIASGRIYTASESEETDDADKTDDADNRILEIEASSPGSWGNDITIDVVYRGNDLFDLTCSAPNGQRENWHRLSFDVPAEADGSVVNALNRSRLVRAKVLTGLDQVLVQEAVRLEGSAPAVGEFETWLHTPDRRALPFLPLTAEVEEKILARAPLEWRNSFSANLSHGQDGLAPTVNLRAEFESGAVSERVLQLHQRSDTTHFESVSVTVGDATLPSDDAAGGQVDSFDLTIRAARHAYGGSRSMHRGRAIVDTETFRGLSLDPEAARYIVNVVNDIREGSKIVVASDVRRSFGRYVRVARETYPMRGGLGIRNFSGVADRNKPFELLDPGQAKGLLITANIPDVTLIAAPDIMPKFTAKPAPSRTDCSCGPAPVSALPTLEPQTRLNAPNFTHDEITYLQSVLVAICEVTRDRFAILDMPLNGDGFDEPHAPARETLAWRRKFSTSYAALYAPWIVAADHDELPGDARVIPPSGHMAGIYARLETVPSLRKSPANERLENIVAVSESYSSEMFGDLTADGVNVIYSDSSGARISAARTLSYDRTYRYVGVRRLTQMIERGLRTEGMIEAFEPNDGRLWRDISRLTRSFLMTLYDHGLLDGATPDDAFFVRCDETTNPVDQIDQGMVVCLLGIKMPAPAEFITMRLGRTEDSTILLN